MSKKKIHATNLAEVIANQLAVHKKEAEAFIKELIAVLEARLMANESVKIKGLGVFKLQWNEPRKSVDVNTGKDIVIDGYYKIVFSPEAELKEFINQPYAHLESVVLDEDVPDTVPDDVPLRIFDEQATEIKDILFDINSMHDHSDEKGNENHSAEVSTKMKEKPLNTNAMEKKSDQKGKKSTKKEEKVAAGHNVQSSNEEKKVKEVYSKKTEKKSRVVILMFLIGIIIGAALIYTLSFLHVLPEFSPTVMVEVQEKITEDVPGDALAQEKDKEERTVNTLADGKADKVQPVAEQESETSVENLLKQPRVYTEFIASEKVRPGSRLARIAERHYGVKEFWVYIFEANRDKLKTPGQIKPGMLLQIPKLNPVLADKDNPVCMDYARQLHALYENE